MTAGGACWYLGMPSSDLEEIRAHARDMRERARRMRAEAAAQAELARELSRTAGESFKDAQRLGASQLVEESSATGRQRPGRSD